MTTGTPWLSVLIPARNVARWLPESLDSILSQADAGVELVLLDDASTDDTGRIARDYATRDPRIRALHNATAVGVATGRNRLLDEARGDYCWFVDSDDALARGAIAALRAVVTTSAPDLVLCDYRTLHASGGLHPGDWRRRSTFEGGANQLATPESRLTGLLLAGQLHVWSKIATRACWSRIRFDDGRVFEDVAPSLDLAIYASTTLRAPLGWVRYRQRDSSLVHTIDARTLHDRLHSLDQVAERTAQAQTRELMLASAYYRARGFAWLARRLDESAADASLRDAARRAFDRHFPDRGAGMLTACRVRGWHLRARRLARDLAPLRS
ncbi:glycosyltransferase family 2 protein [Lysobacter sp. TY2-98]|uniref:glycosyltransferase family 2 protein n=1 Tax=Lysobacter sp. TY2-98 TaxID=2290922 RepID=UPI0013B3BD44|nr:glycosyltransferase family 2 protein [Lysobacter sp. TY2-98]